MTIKAKICGITTEDAVEAAVSGYAAFLGFVFFAKSPRNISPERAAELSRMAPDTVKKVAVAVDPTDAELEDILVNFRPDYIQLHGSETPARVREIFDQFSFPIIKALPVRSGDDIAKAGQFTDVAEMLLFDAKSPDNSLPGGNGLQFDWNLLKERDFSIPWLLSGGLNSKNIEEAVRITGAKMLDVSSGVETEPGEKSPALIKEFLQKTAELYGKGK